MSPVELQQRRGEERTPCSASPASDIIKEALSSQTVHPLTVLALDIFSQISRRARQQLLTPEGVPL